MHFPTPNWVTEDEWEIEGAAHPVYPSHNKHNEIDILSVFLKKSTNSS